MLLVRSVSVVLDFDPGRTCCSVLFAFTSKGTPGLQMGQEWSRSYCTVCV